MVFDIVGKINYIIFTYVYCILIKLSMSMNLNENYKILRWKRDLNYLKNIQEKF